MPPPPPPPPPPPAAELPETAAAQLTANTLRCRACTPRTHGASSTGQAAAAPSASRNTHPVRSNTCTTSAWTTSRHLVVYYLHFGGGVQKHSETQERQMKQTKETNERRTPQSPEASSSSNQNNKNNKNKNNNTNNNNNNNNNDNTREAAANMRGFRTSRRPHALARQPQGCTVALGRRAAGANPRSSAAAARPPARQVPPLRRTYHETTAAKKTSEQRQKRPAERKVRGEVGARLPTSA